MHAVTDVTGFGLLGHGLEMARGAGLTLTIDTASVPVLPLAPRFAQEGFVTGASERNWSSYGDNVALPETLALWQRHLLTDPQTSGGLLVSCRAERAVEIRDQITAAGYPGTAIVGRAESGPPLVRVRG